MNIISNGHPHLAKADVEEPVIIAKAYRWQSKTALLVALGMTSTAALPILVAPLAMAG